LGISATCEVAASFAWVTSEFGPKTPKPKSCRVGETVRSRINQRFRSRSQPRFTGRNRRKLATAPPDVLPFTAPVLEGAAKAVMRWGNIVKVADILAAKGSVVITIKPSDTIATLSTLLSEKRIGAVIVSSNGQTIEGVISERDVAYGLATHKADLHALPISALMTKTVITCSLSDNIALVASTMLSRNIRHLPVEEEKRCVGMVSIRDVLKSRLDELQQQAAQLRTFVNEMGRAPQDRE
jgi:CBS domain-containing protein